MRDLLLVIGGALIALGIDHLLVWLVASIRSKTKSNKEGK